MAPTFRGQIHFDTFTTHAGLFYVFQLPGETKQRILHESNKHLVYPKQQEEKLRVETISDSELADRRNDDKFRNLKKV